MVSLGLLIDLNFFDFSPSFQELTNICIWSLEWKSFKINISILINNGTFILILGCLNNIFFGFPFDFCRVLFTFLIRICQNSFLMFMLFSQRSELNGKQIFIFRLFIQNWSHTDKISSTILTVFVGGQSKELLTACSQMILRAGKRYQFTNFLRHNNIFFISCYFHLHRPLVCQENINIFVHYTFEAKILNILIIQSYISLMFTSTDKSNLNILNVSDSRYSQEMKVWCNGMAFGVQLMKNSCHFGVIDEVNREGNDELASDNFVDESGRVDGTNIAKHQHEIECVLLMQLLHLLQEKLQMAIAVAGYQDFLHARGDSLLKIKLDYQHLLVDCYSQLFRVILFIYSHLQLFIANWKMNHLCFIVDNSLPMVQKAANGMSFLDFIKSSIENALRNLTRIGFPNNNEYIHLFGTSTPESYLSSFEHEESHLNCQLKCMSAEVYTNPATTIQHAIEHISRFRVLSESQNFLGYREGIIFEPALIILLTNKMNGRKIQNIIAAIESQKIQMRSQYKFITFVICPPAPSEKNIYTEEIFKKNVESMLEVKLLEKMTQKLQGEIKLAVNYQYLSNTLWNSIQSYKPSLLLTLESKEIKRKIPEFQYSDRGSRLLQEMQSKFIENLLTLKIVPLRLWKIPMPCFTTYLEENQEIKIEKLGKLHFYIDFTKKYKENNSIIMPENRYRVLSGVGESSEGQIWVEQQKYPIYFEYKNAQCLIGLLTFSSRGSSEIYFYFANFISLNNILKNVEARGNSKVIENNLYVYLASIPIYYHKFLEPLLQKLNLQINYQIFDQISFKQQQQVQSKIENIRMIQRKNVNTTYQVNLQKHQAFKSQCCPIYSQFYEEYAQNMSLKQRVQKVDAVEEYFSKMLEELFEFKKKIGINDYLTIEDVHDIPMAKELDKYSSLRRLSGEEDFNQNITINLGNPYKKKRKPNQHQQIEVKHNQVQYAIHQSTIGQSPQALQTLEEKIQKIEAITKNIQANTKNIVEADTKSQIDENIIKQEQIKSAKWMESRQNQKKIKIKRCSVLEKVNEISTQKGIYLPFNPVNVRSELFLQNSNILKKLAELKQVK